MTCLSTLSLRDNRISVFPEFLFGIGTLTSIDFTNNHLTRLSDKPYRVKELSKLHSLFIGGNNIGRLPFELSQMTEMINFSSVGNNLPKSLQFCCYTKEKWTRHVQRIKDFYNSGYFQALQLLCIRKYHKQDCFLGLFPVEIVKQIAQYIIEFSSNGKKKKRGVVKTQRFL